MIRVSSNHIAEAAIGAARLLLGQLSDKSTGHTFLLFFLTFHIKIFFAVEQARFAMKKKNACQTSADTHPARAPKG